MTANERGRALELGLDLRRIWEAATTTPAERKQLLRAAFDDVVVKVDRDGKVPVAHITLVWQGGATNELEVVLRKKGQHRRTVDESIIEDVRRMAEVMSDDEIARTLCRRGVRTATGLPYTSQRVNGLRRRHGIAEYAPDPSDNSEPTYTAVEAAKELGVSHFTVLRWLKEGFLVGEQPAPHAPWQIKLGPSVRKIVSGPAPKGWLPPKEAAKALGISRREVLHWVQTGKLEAVVAGRGRRSGVRINVLSSGCTTQPSLFANPSAQGLV